MNKEEFYDCIHSVDYLAGWWDEKGNGIYIMNKYRPHKLLCVFFRPKWKYHRIVYGYINNLHERHQSLMTEYFFRKEQATYALKRIRDLRQ